MITAEICKVFKFGMAYSSYIEVFTRCETLNICWSDIFSFKLLVRREQTRINSCFELVWYCEITKSPNAHRIKFSTMAGLEPTLRITLKDIPLDIWTPGCTCNIQYPRSITASCPAELLRSQKFDSLAH